MVSLKNIRKGAAIAATLSVALFSGNALAQKKYDPGASDTEIKIGHTIPYSGPLSGYGAIGKAIDSYFKKVNDDGGINGRKITFITLDDAYSPPKTVEAVRRLVEQDQVLFIFSTLGTAPNTAIQKYMNAKKVPQLFVATGASKWGDPKRFPWTMGWQPDYATEAELYAKYILANIKDPKIAVLYQNDDFGKDYLEGFHRGLGEEGRKLIVTEVSYEVTDPTVDSQVIQLKASGANVFFNASSPKAAAQSIRKAAEIGWKPAHFLSNTSINVATVLKPAGLENSVGIITANYRKDSTDPQWADDPGMKAWKEWMDKYNPGANQADQNFVYGYTVAQSIVEVLKQAGDNLTRENIMKQAASIKNQELPLLLPGIKINTSATDYYPMQAMQMARFNGTNWELFGEVISADPAE